MCSVSAIMRNQEDQWRKPLNQFHQFAYAQNPPSVSKEDFEALKKQVEELKTLLLAAKKFNEATGQPECETEEKVILIKRIASIFGVDMKEVFAS